jgi:hypothetical protein
MVREEMSSIGAATAGPCNDIRTACNDKWKSTQPIRAPKILYHYTKPEAFQKILESGTVWASDIRYMNDASEVTHVADILKSIIKEAVKSVHEDDERELLERIAKTFNVTDMVRVFACCFSELGDSIPQWIAYAGRRGGFAMGLGLRPHILQSQYATKDGTVAVVSGQLVKVVYDDDKLVTFSKDLIAHVVKLYRDARVQVAEHLRTFIMARFCQAWQDGFSPLLLSFKQPGFQHEQEWRLVYYLSRFERSDEAPQYHVGTMGLTPHLPLKLIKTHGFHSGHFPLLEVVVGPTAERELALEASKFFLAELGYSSALISVKASKMPLRF